MTLQLPHLPPPMRLGLKQHRMILRRLLVSLSDSSTGKGHGFELRNVIALTKLPVPMQHRRRGVLVHPLTNV